MKKIVIKKKITSIAKVVEPTHIHYVSTMDMKEGEEYVGVGCTTVLTLKKIISYEGANTGLRALRSTIVECNIIASNLGGDQLVASLWGTNAVLTNCPELIELIKKEHANVNNKIRVYTKVSKSPKKDAEGNVVVRVPRGDISPITGYGMGTQGHAIGLLMLEGRCSPHTRGLIIPKIVAYLMKEQGFDEKKAKSVGQSWYSTCWTRKPQLYQKEWK